MRKALSLGTTAAALAAMVAVAAPVSAESTGVTFALTGGGLSLTVPSNPTVTLNSSTLPVGTASVTAALNATTVTDSRGQVLAPWKVQVSGSDYVNNAGTVGDTSDDYAIPRAQGAMFLNIGSLGALVPTGGLIVTSAALAANKASLAAVADPADAPSLIAGTTTGSGSVTFTPSLTVTIPAGAIAGTYTGSVVQTAS